MKYALVGACLILLTIAQLLQKRAASHFPTTGPLSRRLLVLLHRNDLWWAGGCLAAGTFIWLAVLYHNEVSRAFPLLSLVFVSVTLISRFLLHESVTPLRWLGIATIGVGVALVAAT